MKTKKIVLVIGRHADMLANIMELIARHGYDTMGALTNEEALEKFLQHDIDAVIIGGGVDEDSRQLFHRSFPAKNPAVIIIDAHPHTVMSDLAAAFPK